MTLKTARKGEVVALVTALLADQKGASAVEYGVLLAGIALVSAIAVFAVGDTLATFFGTIVGYFSG